LQGDGEEFYHEPPRTTTYLVVVRGVRVVRGRFFWESSHKNTLPYEGQGIDER